MAGNGARHLAEPAKITIFAGHYGSGKTTAAVNYALCLAKTRPGVALCDMDIVNPYFRGADAAQVLARGGVELISPPYANTNVELYLPPAQAVRVFDAPGLTSVIDLGGDDRGALAIGRYAQRLNGRGDLALWMVVNPYRPLTRDMTGLRAMRGEIETAARLRFTGIVNNTNLGGKTTREDIEFHFPLVENLSEALELPVVMTCVGRGIALDIPPGLGERFEVECWGNRFGV
jgi:hypothetical protein